MSKTQSASFHKTVYVGTHGNVSLATGKALMASAAVNHEFDVLELPIGLELTGVRLFTDGLGASVTVTVKAGDVELVTAEDVASDTAKAIPISPVYVDEKCALTVVVKGAAATGELIVQPEYVNVGF